MGVGVRLRGAANDFGFAVLANGLSFVLPSNHVCGRGKHLHIATSTTWRSFVLAPTKILCPERLHFLLATSRSILVLRSFISSICKGRPSSWLPSVSSGPCKISLGFLLPKISGSWFSAYLPAPASTCQFDLQLALHNQPGTDSPSPKFDMSSSNSRCSGKPGLAHWCTHSLP